MVLAALGGVVTGGLIGLINGYFNVKRKITSFIVTICTHFSDLEGKKVGTAGASGGMRLSVLKMLEKNGVSTDNVDLIANGVYHIFDARSVILALRLVRS